MFRTGEPSPLKSGLRVWETKVGNPPASTFPIEPPLLLPTDPWVIRCPPSGVWFCAQMRRSQTGADSRGADRVHRVTLAVDSPGLRGGGERREQALPHSGPTSQRRGRNSFSSPFLLLRVDASRTECFLANTYK